MRILLSAVVPALCAVVLNAATINVPADQPTIQAGIDAASDGDTVLVADGTYTGDGNRDLDFGGKLIVVKSQNGPDSTIIDCQGDSLNPHRGFYFHNGEDSTAVVDGFTVQNGCPYNSWEDGGGVLCSSSPTFMNCIFTSNFAANSFSGAGFFTSSSPTLIDCSFADNNVTGFACADGGSPTIMNCIFSGNSTGISIINLTGNPSSATIQGCSFVGNTSGGVYLFFSSVTIIDCFFSENLRFGICFEPGIGTVDGSVFSKNSGWGIVVVEGMAPAITNCTFTGNDSAGVTLWGIASLVMENCIVAYCTQGVAISCRSQNPTSVSLACCDIYGNAGGDWVGCIEGQDTLNGNFSLDPLFCDTANGDFHIDSLSPCAPNSPLNQCGVLIGAYGVGCAGSIPAPVLSLSSSYPFADTTSYYPSSGDEGTMFEFRINYRDSSNYWPQAGYPRLVLDWDGNGIIDHENDGYFPMSQSEADSVFTDGADYSLFTTIPAGGSPQIKFEAVSSYGLSTTYPLSGWLDGPTVASSNSSDLFIYADDITYSTYPQNPQVGQPVVIYVRVHNDSPDSYNSVGVNLYIDDVLVRNFNVNLPARDANGTPGLVDISFDTVFSETAFLEIRATIDPENGIDEWNENNNTASRSLLVGDYGLPGSIHVNAYGLGSYYPSTWASSGGSAWYEVDGDSLRHVSGAPAYIELLETGIGLDTVHLNDNGYFNYLFRTPSDTGLYHVLITVTDFTLTDTAIVPFQVVPYPTDLPNLVIDFSLSGFPLSVCGNNVLSIDNAVVQNIGTAVSGSCQATLTREGETLLNVTVPPLEVGETYVLSQTPIEVTYTEPGRYWVRGVVDYNDEVDELCEYDNHKTETFWVWCCPEDLSPTAIRLGGVAYQDIAVSILAQVCNLGSLPADDFSLVMVDSCWAGTDTITIMGNLSLSAYGDCGWFTVADYVFADTGLHRLQVTVDPEGAVTECSEDNNTFSMAVYVRLAPESDLVMHSEWIDVSDINPQLGDTLCILNAEVYNIGLGTAYDVDVVFTMSGNALGDVIRIDSIPNYGTDNHRPSRPTDSVIVDTCEPNTRILEVCVDPFSNINELDELNNCATKSIVYCECCMPPIRGNVDYDGADQIDISDLVYLVDYMFNGGPAPVCWPEANINANGPDDQSGIDISDLVYLVDYMFNSGPPPVACP